MFYIIYQSECPFLQTESSILSVHISARPAPALMYRSSRQQQVGMEGRVLCSLTHPFSTYFVFDNVLGTCHVLLN